MGEPGHATWIAAASTESSATSCGGLPLKYPGVPAAARSLYPRPRSPPGLASIDMSRSVSCDPISFICTRSTCGACEKTLESRSASWSAAMPGLSASQSAMAIASG